jgi:hypothetical protein
MSFALIFGILITIFVASQIYWYLRARALVKRFAKTNMTRILAIAAGLAIYLAFFRSQLWSVWTARKPHAFDVVRRACVGSVSVVGGLFAGGVSARHADVADPARGALHQRAEIARQAAIPGALRQRSGRRTIRGRRLWIVLRPAQSPSYPSLDSSGPAAQILRGLPHRAAFRHPHRFIHDRGANPQIRAHRERSEAGFDRVNRRLRHLGPIHAAGRGECARRLARAFRHLRLPWKPRGLVAYRRFHHADVGWESGFCAGSACRSRRMAKPSI